jgi:uncharacterized protein YmfQ (DUF2313 family)
MRYEAAPSRTSAGSWNVIDRALPAGANVEIPHVTRVEAQRCADCLNGGRDAWAWLVDEATWDDWKYCQ